MFCTQPFNEAVTQAVDLKKGLFGGKDVNLDIISILEWVFILSGLELICACGFFAFGPWGDVWQC